MAKSKTPGQIGHIGAKKNRQGNRQATVHNPLYYFQKAKTQLASAQTERDKSFYESKCATLDRQIDTLVYELYDLTPEEIALVEGQPK